MFQFLHKFGAVSSLLMTQAWQKSVFFTVSACMFEWLHALWIADSSKLQPSFHCMMMMYKYLLVYCLDDSAHIWTVWQKYTVACYYLPVISVTRNCSLMLVLTMRWTSDVHQILIDACVYFLKITDWCLERFFLMLWT